MPSNRIILTIGLALALGLFVLGRNQPVAKIAPGTPSPKFQEIASVLWKAHIHADRIEFVSSEKVIHSHWMTPGLKHRYSVSYRNLWGYFDPVLVTVWGDSQGERAWILDPVRQLVLVETVRGLDMDVSISDDNKIVLTYTEQGTGNTESRLVWP